MYKFRPELLKAQMVIQNKTPKFLADKIGIDPSTFSRKMNLESEFTRLEMSVLKSELNLSNDEMNSIFFAA